MGGAVEDDQLLGLRGAPSADRMAQPPVRSWRIVLGRTGRLYRGRLVGGAAAGSGPQACLTGATARRSG